MSGRTKSLPPAHDHAEVEVQSDALESHDFGGITRENRVSLRAATGPLPSPETLAAYQRIDPAIVTHFLSAASQQAKHRQAVDTTIIRNDFRLSMTGVVTGGVVALSGLATAAYTASLGHPATAAVIGTIDLAALVGVFVYGTRIRAEGG